MIIHICNQYYIRNFVFFFSMRTPNIVEASGLTNPEHAPVSTILLIAHLRQNDLFFTFRKWPLSWNKMFTRDITLLGLVCKQQRF